MHACECSPLHECLSNNFYLIWHSAKPAFSSETKSLDCIIFPKYLFSLNACQSHATSL